MNMRESPRRSAGPPLVSILCWVLVSLAAGAAGGIASQPGEWYAALSKPSWNPPNWVFGPVWTTLYVMMGLAAALAWPGRATRAGRAGFLLFGLQLALNALWSWIFFRWHRLDLAFVELTVLWVTILGTIIAFRRIRPLAGHLLLPYLAWVTFAGVLNFAIARLNPGGVPIEPAAPLVGVAAADCAPWDGAATSIYLSRSAEPSSPPELQLVVYLSVEGLPGRRIELGRQEAGSGIALHCESPSACTTSSAGIVEFSSPAEAGVLAGAYRVEFDDGVVAGTFRATWSKRVALCG